MSIKKPLVFVERPVLPIGIQLLSEVCEVTRWEEDRKIPRHLLLNSIKGVDAVFVCSTATVDKEFLDAAGPSLKVIGTMSVGLDHIDVVECKARGVLLGYTPDVLTDAVAELTIGLLLATSRRLKEGFSAIVDGGWGTWQNGVYLAGKELKDSVVGIVGLGRIGLAIAKRLQPFGVSKFLYCGHNIKPGAKDIGAEFVPFEELLKNSDFVIVCCSLNDENKGLFDASAFRQMRDNAIFINVSRGSLVNQEDLYEALTTGQILAAGLDVATPEPLPQDHPLLKLPNCVISPHLGSATFVTRAKMCELTARNILARLKGQPLPSPVPML